MCRVSAQPSRNHCRATGARHNRASGHPRRTNSPRSNEAELQLEKPSGLLPLAFHGSAREYFRIWTVNLCLTLLTLGIFSAWAKVRKKRYLYSSVTLDGTPFQYLGQPGPILKGRIVAAALFALYYSGNHFLPVLLPYVVGGAALLAPWVIVRSAAFNARYSAFRNMTWRFDGTYWDAVKQLHGWGLIPAIVLGLMFGWFGHYGWAAILFGAFALAYPFWQRRLKRFVVTNTCFGSRMGEFSATGGEFVRVYLSAVWGIAEGLFVAGLVALCLTVPISPEIKGMLGALAVFLAIYVGYVGVSAYLQAGISNLVWNRTRLGPLRFHSNLSGYQLTTLYVTNSLAVIVSLGLLTPWAVMRTTRYRVECMRVLLDGDVAELHGTDAAAVPAVGMELGGFFDLDFSL